MNDQLINSVNRLKRVFQYFFITFLLLGFLSVWLLLKVRNPIYTGFASSYLVVISMYLVLKHIPDYLHFIQSEVNEHTISVHIRSIQKINFYTAICILAFVGILAFKSFGLLFSCGSALGIFIFGFLLIVFTVLKNYVLETILHELQR